MVDQPPARAEASALAHQFVARRYAASDADEWDRFVAASTNGTFLHTRRYLAYHGARFEDQSRVVTDNAGTTVAVLPAARGGATNEAISHPGLTFGGLIFDRHLRAPQVEAAIGAAIASLVAAGFERLDYRPVPGFARAEQSDEDVFALYRAGGSAYSRGLTSVIDLRTAGPSKTRLGCIKKARRLGVELSDDLSRLPEYWELLNAQLRSRHDAHPVHSVEELQYLASAFPDQVVLRVAQLDGAVVAGAVCYRYRPHVLHTQYLASDERGRGASALDLVIGSFIEEAERAGVRFLSFGISNDPTSGALNEDLLQYKRSFGASSQTVIGLRVDLTLR